MSDRLNPGESLGVNDSLVSPNGQFSLALQSDGNLVLYEADNQPVWAAGTDGQDVARATMQEDGNLVISSSAGDAVWASGTNGADGAALILQDDRNLVIYGGDGSPVWATNTGA
jgi:hypothetical protein